MKKQVGSRRYFTSDTLERKEPKPFGNTQLEEEYEKQKEATMKKVAAQKKYFNNYGSNLALGSFKRKGIVSNKSPTDPPEGSTPSESAAQALLVTAAVGRDNSSKDRAGSKNSHK